MNQEKITNVQSRITVLIVGPDLDAQGGISAVIREYVHAGIQDRINLRIIATYQDGSILKKVFVFIEALPRVIVYLLRNKPAVLHINLSLGGSFVRKSVVFYFARLLRKKIIVHLHGSNYDDFMQSNSLIRTISRYIFRNAHAVITLSTVWFLKMSEYTSQERIRLLYNPISIPKLNHDEHDGIRMLFLGRLGERKGIYDLLRVINGHPEEYRDKKIKFILAGDGDVDNVRKYIDDYKIADLVEAPGWVSGDKKEKLLNGSDILLLPSYNEQMPMAILDAMSYGCPVISTKIAGIPEMVSDGVNGILIEPGDLNALHDAIMRLASDANLRERMGQKSLEIVREKFDSRKIVGQLISIYQKVVNEV